MVAGIAAKNQRKLRRFTSLPSASREAALSHEVWLRPRDPGPTRGARAFDRSHQTEPGRTEEQPAHDVG